MERLIGKWIQFRWLIFGITLVLSALAVYPASHITFDRRIDRMFAQDDPRYASYQRLKELFGDSETSLMAYDDPELFTVAGMRRLNQFHQQIERVVGVRSVLSLATARRPSAPLDRRSLAEQLEQRVIGPEKLRAEILDCRLYQGKLVSDSGLTAVLWVELISRDDSTVDRKVSISALREVCQSLDPPAVLAGGPVLVDEVFTNLERDGLTMGITSSLILTIVLALLFRNLRWLLLPLAVVQLALVWTKALLVVSQLQMSMVSSPLVALVTVIGVATVIHITVRFREQRMVDDTETALRKTLLYIWRPIFWTSLTTTMGFAALLISHVIPVRDFGVMMSLGAGMVFVAVLVLTPVFVLTFPKYSTLPGSSSGEDWIGSLLQQSAATLVKRPRMVLSSVALMLLVIAAGISKLQVATDFQENFRRSSPIVQSFDFLLERIKGVNALDILIELPPESAQGKGLDQVLQDLRLMQEDLRQQPTIAHTLSTVDIIDFVSQQSPIKSDSDPTTETPPVAGSQNLESAAQTGLGSLFRNSNPAALLPETTRLRLLELIGPQYISRLWNRQQNTMRVIVQGENAAGADQKQALVETTQNIARKRFPNAEVTGSFVLLVYLVQSLLADQWSTFAVSIVAILGMLAIAFRSLRLGVIAMIPNITPILMVLGAMGWMGMKVNMASAMLASVSLGLSVDFSIHYLYRYLYERRLGRDFYAAINEAHGSVGLAMVLANLALIAGFLVLLLSSLIPTVHFGLLVSVAMLGGLVGNLFVLPLLLRYGDWRRNDTIVLASGNEVSNRAKME